MERYYKINQNKEYIMKSKTLFTITAAVVLALSFTSCASTEENMRAQGYGPEYSKGYGDGCDSGKKAAGSMFDQFKKDVSRYDGNHKYKEGWNDGYKQCRSEEASLERSIENSTRDAAIRNSNNNRSSNYEAKNAAYDASRQLSAQDMRNIKNL